MKGERRADLDPFPNLTWLRENAPVSLADDGPAGAGVYFVTRYRLVRSCLTDPRLGDEPPGAGKPSFERTVLDRPAEEHARMRRVLRRAFSLVSVRGLRSRIAEICRDTIDTFAAAGRADLMADYAQVIPVAVIHEVIGIPPAEQRVPPGELMDRFWQAVHAPDPDDDAVEFIEDYVRWIVDYKRAHPGDDVTTMLLDALAAGEVRDEAELRGILASVLGPGHMTTVQLLSTGIVRLLEHRDLLATAIERPQRWPDVVDEILRFDSVVLMTNNRYAVEDLTIGDVLVPKGSTVLMSIGGANRDPERFANPDEIDIDRPHGAHVAFGHGPHFCLGAHLGRAEGEIAFDTLFRALPDLRLACPIEDIVWTWGPMERGPAGVPAVFTPVASAS
jgi:cytochrome P450